MPPQITCASALRGKTRKYENHVFHSIGSSYTHNAPVRYLPERKKIVFCDVTWPVRHCSPARLQNDCHSTADVRRQCAARSRQYVWTTTYRLGDRRCPPQRILRARPSIFWCTMWRRAVQQGCSPVQPHATFPASAPSIASHLQSATMHAFIATTWSYHTSVSHSYMLYKNAYYV